MDFYWGTYRGANTYKSVWAELESENLAGVDTAPNYDGGQAEDFVGDLNVSRSSSILTKVGYTGGDAPQMKARAFDEKHCIEANYVHARVASSIDRLRPVRGMQMPVPLECVFLHNPEHVLEEDQNQGIQKIVRAMAALQEFVNEGKINSIGFATWELRPFGEICDKILDALLKENLMKDFKYWMYPINILRMDAVNAVRDDELSLAELDVKLLASAPFAGGDAKRLLGSRFGTVFDGSNDPILQSLAIVKAARATPVVGIRTADQARSFLARQQDEIPSVDCAYHLANLLEKK